ncbi:hypothetical protein Hdeb2414_s0007g00254751 [Helianthus debilis subsp. tardiflorus]
MCTIVYDDVDDAQNLVGCLETHLNFNTSCIVIYLFRLVVLYFKPCN